MRKFILLLIVLAAFTLLGLEANKVISAANQKKAQESISVAEERIDALYKEMELNIQLAEKDGFLIPLDQTKLNKAESVYKEAEHHFKKPVKELDILDGKVFEMRQFQKAISKAQEIEEEIKNFKNKNSTIEDNSIELLKTKIASKSESFANLPNQELKRILREKFTKELEQLNRK